MGLVERVNLEQDKITIRRAVSRQCDIFFFLQICLFIESSGDCEVWRLLLKKVLGFVLEPVEVWNFLVVKVHFRFSSDFRSCCFCWAGQ